MDEPYKTRGQKLYEFLCIAGVFTEFWRDLEEEDRQPFEQAATSYGEWLFQFCG
jgi:hypothetical protein